MMSVTCRVAFHKAENPPSPPPPCRLGLGWEWEGTPYKISMFAVLVRWACENLMFRFGREGCLRVPPAPLVIRPFNVRPVPPMGGGGGVTK